MLNKPRLADVKIIGLYTGKIIVGIGLMMLLPLVTALIFREWNAALDFVIGMTAAFILGLAVQQVCETRQEMNWVHGLVVAAFSWLVAMVIGAIPHYLSGHFSSFLDASFDLMSGYTTTGMYLLQDLDHISIALNMWRHVLTYVGGQGIIVVALTFLIRGTSGAFMMYVGEGKEEKLLPNVIRTARAIWLVSLSYLAVGTIVLAVAMAFEGIAGVRAFLHGLWIFMAAWSTGGFAPMSYNVGYYHSLSIELMTMIFFIIGSFNFALHWAVWTGNRREILRNIEIVSFVTTLFLTVALATAGLMRLGVYGDTVAMFRKGFYQLASGHTTTGFMTIYSREFVRQWGALAMLATIIAMAIGASAASTAGGFKGLRVGIITKGFAREVRKLMAPESAVVVSWFHHIKDTVMEDKHVRAAMFIVLSYIIVYFVGGVIGTLYGHPFVEALFESVSAGANVGLSAGVTTPAMPALMKVYYIIAMWAGRLEFMAIFALVAFVIAAVRGK